MDGTIFDIGNLKDTEKRSTNRREVRRRAQAIYLGNDTVLCRVLGKYKFYVSASDVGFGAHVMLDGHWEFAVTEFIARSVVPGMSVMDLGANFGYYTLLMADLVGPGGKVFSVEPNPIVATHLRNNININGYATRVSLDRRAIWDASGEKMTFRVPANEPKNGRLLKNPNDPLPVSRSVTELEVETVALDDLVAENASFIKADIEGAEEHLWKGMQKFVSRNPDLLLLLEFNCMRCADARGTLKSIGNIFPLRYLNDESRVCSATLETILNKRSDDWMLVLSRRPLN